MLWQKVVFEPMRMPGNKFEVQGPPREVDIEQAIGEPSTDAETASTKSSGLFSGFCANLARRHWLLPSVIIILGVAASSAFLYLGISSLVNEQAIQFSRSVALTARQIEQSWRP